MKENKERKQWLRGREKNDKHNERKKETNKAVDEEKKGKYNRKRKIT